MIKGGVPPHLKGVYPSGEPGVGPQKYITPTMKDKAQENRLNKKKGRRMRVDISKGSQMYLIMMDAWEILKAYGGVEDSKEYFDRFADAVNSFTKKYNHHPLADGMGIGLVEYVDREYKRMKGA